MKEMVPLFQLIISVLTFPLVIWQLWNVIKGLRSQTYQRVYELMISIDRFFIDKQDMKRYFYDNAEPPEGVDGSQIYSIAEMMLDYFDNVYHQRSSMPPRTFEGFSAYMRDIFRSSPVLRQYVNGHKNWYPKDLLDLLGPSA